MSTPAEVPSPAADSLAVDALLERHLPGLRAFVRLRMGPELRARESVSDLVQSTCVEILAHLDRFQHRGEEQFRHWLFSTCLRKVKNKVKFYRAARRDAGREVSPAIGDTSQDRELADAYARVATPSGELALQERIREFETAFDRLPDPYREVITLSRVCGLPHRETATILGRTEAATRTLLYRALAELGMALGVSRGPRGRRDP